jgi:4-phospho-D-threonate 3-dehydrogenase / 4-phospho-D-erythronate 3-dehydrogenase
MIVVSMGCPSGIGPEVAVRAAASLPRVPRVLVGDPGTFAAAADLVGVDRALLVPYRGSFDGRHIEVLAAGTPLRSVDRRPGRPSALAGRAQLDALEAAFELVRQGRGRALVTGPISKAAVAGCGLRRARRFRGHTEWLETLDRSSGVTMCFWSPRFSTSLVTTHLPISRVARSISAEGVERSIIDLVQLLRAAGTKRPRVAVASLNPHGGESELLGTEETRAIAPGCLAARRRLGRRASIVGPMGAETAFRQAVSGLWDGVVAMFHDQATIPMKLTAFGDSVNVTMGLSIVRTSVDHGTGYDIAWRGEANPAGMRSAMELGERLAARWPPRALV